MQIDALVQATPVSESSLVCVAVGAGGIGNVEQPLALWTDNGGSMWSRGSMPTGTSGLLGVSCRGTTCLAGAGYQLGLRSPLLARSTDSGVHWQIGSVPMVRNGIGVTACSTSANCVLSTYKGIFLSTNAGRSWSPLSIRGVGAFGTITCPTASFCIATGTTPPTGSAPLGALALIAISRDGGRSWSVPKRLPDGMSARSVQCISAQVCDVAANSNGRGHLLSTADGGSLWTTHPLPKSLARISGVACTTTTSCFAWDDFAPRYRPLGTTTDNSGASWTTPTLAPQDTDVGAMTCPTTSNCELVGVDLLGTVILGSSTGFSQWVSQPLPVGVVKIEGASCASLAACMLAAQATRRGAIFRTPDKGEGWSQSTLHVGTGTVMAVTCLTTTFCAAAANGLLTSSDGGTTWRLAALHLGSQELEGVACSSPTECVLVGGKESSGLLTQHFGDSVVYLWHDGVLRRVNAPTSVSPLSSVTCVGSTCVGVGGFSGAYSYGPVATQLSVIVSHDGGATWSRSGVPQAVAGLNSVACATSQSCVAVGQVMGRGGSQPGIVATSNAGTTWAVVPTIRRNNQVINVTQSARRPGPRTVARTRSR